MENHKKHWDGPYQRGAEKEVFPNVPAYNSKLQQTKLQSALKGLDMAEIVPHLSEQEKRVLGSRFRFSDGSRQMSLKKAAKTLGFTVDELRRIEDEALAQVSYIAGIGKIELAEEV